MHLCLDVRNPRRNLLLFDADFDLKDTDLLITRAQPRP